jgi:hypothetical protein
MKPLTSLYDRCLAVLPLRKRIVSARGFSYSAAVLCCVNLRSYNRGFYLCELINLPPHLRQRSPREEPIE